jgi:hypothetical protein
MKRAIILLFDSFGIGASEDAEKYGDVGADTLGHIASACAEGHADKPGVRQLVLGKIPQAAIGKLRVYRCCLNGGTFQPLFLVFPMNLFKRLLNKLSFLASWEINMPQEQKLLTS